MAMQGFGWVRAALRKLETKITGGDGEQGIDEKLSKIIKVMLGNEGNLDDYIATHDTSKGVTDRVSGEWNLLYDNMTSGQFYTLNEFNEIMIILRYGFYRSIHIFDKNEWNILIADADGFAVLSSCTPTALNVPITFNGNSNGEIRVVVSGSNMPSNISLYYK